MSERELWEGEVPDISGGRPLPPVSVHADGLIAGGCHDYRATLVCTAVHLARLLAASQAEAERLRGEVGRLREAANAAHRVVSFYASVIKSGEPWTDECAAAYRSIDAPAVTGEEA